MLHGAGAALAVALPLWLEGTPVADHTYSPANERFELFAFSGSVYLLVAALLEWFLSDRSRVRAAALGAGVLVGMHTLAYLAEHSAPSWDYHCYEHAARLLEAGDDPYRYDNESGLRYLYPPLFAQAIETSWRLCREAGFPPNEAGWTTFYLWQCLQFFLVVGGFALTARFARDSGIPALWAIGLAAVLWTVSGPLIRTLRHNQVNILLLDLSLLGLVLMRRSPEACGAALAAAIHLKIYPLLLLGPLTVTGRWRAIAATIIGSCLLLALSFAGPGGYGVWEQFASAAQSFPTSTLLRDNSLSSVIWNAGAMPVTLAGGDPATWQAAHAGLVRVARILAVLWLLWRFVARERAAGAEPGGGPWRLEGHCADAFAAMLLLSPLVWEHHYVLAIPVAVWALAVSRGRWFVLAVAGTVLVYGVPTFDLWPFGANRLAGLLMLMIAARPSFGPWRDPGDLPAVEAR